MVASIQPNNGVSWAGTAEEDKAYRNPTGGGYGFNLQQWFTDQGIEGDNSYYRYAKIRGLGETGFTSGAGGPTTDAGMAYLNLGYAYGSNTPISELYTYSGTGYGDVFKMPAQNIVSLGQLGIDTWGRPLPAGFQTPEQMAASRLVNQSGLGESAGGGAGILSSTTPTGSDLALSDEETLGLK